VSDVSQGPGWWQASDGKWYPPSAQPGPPAPPPSVAAQGPQTSPLGGPQPGPGWMQQPPQQTGQLPGAPQQPPKRNRRGLWVAIVVGAVIIIVVIIVATTGSSNNNPSASGNTGNTGNTGSGNTGSSGSGNTGNSASGNSGASAAATTSSTTTMPPTTTTTQSPAQYEAGCTGSPPYGQLTSPNAPSGTCVTYQANVFQYDTNTGKNDMLVYVTNSGYGLWTNIVELKLPSSVAGQGFIQDDVIQFWGPTAGTETYSTNAGGHNTVPVINVAYAKLISQASGNTGSTGNTP